MVVFTCGHCGESVQKPKVEKHYMTKCRNRSPNLSCMDCFKDFLGNDYEQHTKCITEEQRYSAKGFVAKEKKGEQKQNAWVEMVQSVLDEQKDAPRNVLRILEAVSKHNNTPRKKPKFINFVKNVCGHKTNPKDMDAAWDLISVKLAALSVQNNDKNKKQDDVNKEDEDKNEVNNQSNNLSVAKLSISEPEDNSHLDHETKPNGDIAEDKKSKKQKKEEKKRKKYEAELQSANDIPEEEIEPEKPSKKDKKKKNKFETPNVDDDNDENNKKMKRKRQDTVNSTEEVTENGTADSQMTTEKVKKKKPKHEKVNDDESATLHDQNVGNTVASEEKTYEFSWHAVIMSVLEKKGPEVPFKRLQKKVLSEYYEVTGQDVDDRIVDKFIKKLRSAPNVRVDKNRVLLVQ